MVNVFIPYDNFEVCARCLDNKRLYKQIVECKQILNAIKGETKGYANHPATVMWKRYPHALRRYQISCIREWLNRRWMLDFETITDLDKRYAWKQGALTRDTLMPHWWGDKDIHDSHKANLYRKDPEHYKQFNLGIDMPYVWVNDEGKKYIGTGKNKTVLEEQ